MTMVDVTDNASRCQADFYPLSLSHYQFHVSVCIYMCVKEG